MTLRLITPDEAMAEGPSLPDHRAATGILLGVFCGTIFWLGLGFGIAAGWALWG